MSRSSTLFAGLAACFALSLGLCVLLPQAQLGSLAPDFKEEDGKISDVYPTLTGGIASAGREVYISQGCQACHSQVVRGAETTDMERGWGVRRTVARDYLFENPPVLGVRRIGPDLANVGASGWRNEPANDSARPAKRDATWHFLHLYHPTAIIKVSNMPAYKGLFDLRKITGSPSLDALALPAEMAPPSGYEVVPKAEAKSLVAYLLSLDRSHPLKEAGAVAVAAKKN
jgi:cytochrome c oxidase cbb3-type subunit 2